MQVFEIKTNRSDYPYIVIAKGFKNALDVLYQKGIYDTNILSVQQIEDYKSDHILHEMEIKTKAELKEEVRREIQKDLPRWMPEPNGAAGGGDRDVYLIRSSKGHYYTSSCIGGDNHYLLLESLEQLPGLPKKE